MPSVNFLPFMQTVPITTKALVGTIVAASTAAFLLAYPSATSRITGPNALGKSIPYLVLVPGESWKYPWSLLTAGLIELTIVELALSVASIGFASRYLERIWGPKELLRFVGVVTVLSNVIAFGFSWLTYLVVGQEDACWGQAYRGTSGLQSGFLVAFTQLIPEHQVQIFGKLKLRVKSLPGIYLLISNVLVIVLGPAPFINVQFGFFVAWVYLRFFKLSEDGLSRGDRSETFAFQYWFPPPIRPIISKAANIVFKLAIRVGLIRGWDEASSSGSYAMLPGPGGARAEAERRRALALKALDARLASGSPAPGTSVAAATAATASVPAAIPVEAVTESTKESKD